jgi:hypothetical protein
MAANFNAELPAFGDLNDDGLQDAVVLIKHQADRDEYVQYLVAYLFNGETFQSVATRNVGGRFLDALRADVQGLADGQDPGRARVAGRRRHLLRQTADRVRFARRATSRGRRSRCGRPGADERGGDAVARLTSGLSCL